MLKEKRKKEGRKRGRDRGRREERGKRRRRERLKVGCWGFIPPCWLQTKILIKN